MSQYLVSQHEDIREKNRYNLQKWHDKLGDENIVIVGTKTLHPNPNRMEDELVYFTYRDRVVQLAAGSEGGGKTIAIEWEAYQLLLMQNAPIVAWDVQKQMPFLKNPLKDKRAIARLALIGIRPEGLKVKTFEPAFTNFNQADVKWSIKLKDITKLSEWEAYQNFIRLISKDELSQANLRAADAIWQDVQRTPRITEDLDFLMGGYETHYKTVMADDKKLGGTVGKSIFATLQQIKMLNLFDGEGIDFFRLLNSKENDIYAFLCSFATSQDSFSYYQVVYSIFLASVLHDGRRRGVIPRVTKIRDEVDEALKTQEAEVIAREIKKDRVEQNNLFYALQYIADANKEMIGTSNAILTTRMRSEKDLELLLRKNPDDLELRKLIHLDISSTPFQFGVVTPDEVIPCYPFSPPAQFHTTF